jgi:DNA-binding transcriptional LysR family regulator
LVHQRSLWSLPQYSKRLLSILSAARNSLNSTCCKEAQDVKRSFSIENNLKRADGKPGEVMPMKDLNNIVYFVRIVEHGSLSAASESLGVAKSMLSQHLSKLEKELGVQLIKRTTRKLHVTGIGARYYEQCLVILEEMDRASNMIENVRTLPGGKLRISSPLNFAQVILEPALTAFMKNYPNVDVMLEISNREEALTTEGYDFALHIGPDMRSSNLIVRSFPMEREMLVASPELLARFGEPRVPADLRPLPSVAGALPPEQRGRYVWNLTNSTAEMCSVPHHPRLIAEDLWVLKQGALAACGVAALPPVLCRDAIDDGRLRHILPHWILPAHKLHAVYHSRRSLSLAARTLINFIASHVQAWLRTRLDETLQVHTLSSTKSRRQEEFADQRRKILR